MLLLFKKCESNFKFIFCNDTIYQCLVAGSICLLQLPEREKERERERVRERRERKRERVCVCFVLCAELCHFLSDVLPNFLLDNEMG